MADLHPRDVIRIFDNQMRAPNYKRLICVCVPRRLFLRINTHPYWPPHIKIHQVDCSDFLDWDSYVELRELVRVGFSELAVALMRPDNPIGRVNDRVARLIEFAAQQAATLSDEMRGIIREGLLGGGGTR
jgi:hypothetical protein